MTISFDRIASAYDHVRAHPSEVAQRIGASLAEICGADVLELGVGTGRIALPLARAGCRVTGVDVSDGMLRVAQAANEPQLALLRGDIARLPLASASFDAIVVVHVLHLLKDWRSALVDGRRALRPGGRFIQGRDWRDPQSCVGQLREQLRSAVMELLPNARPPGAGASIGAVLGELGFALEPERSLVSWVTPISPAEVLAEMASRADAETWSLEQPILDAAMARLTSWALAQYGDLDVTQDVERRFVVVVAR